MSPLWLIYALLLLSLAPISMTQTLANPPKPKWEYRVLRFEAGQCSADNDLTVTLNSAGHEGWELVSYERLSPAFPRDADGSLLLRPAATGLGAQVVPNTADSFEGTISSRMGQTEAGGCMMLLKRQAPEGNQVTR